MRKIAFYTLLLFSLSLFSQNKGHITLDLHINTDTVCPGTEVLLTADITNGVPPYEFRDEQNNVVSPPFFFSPETTTVIILTVTDANGSSDTDSETIDVYNNPTSSIKSDKIHGCQPLQVTFNEESPINNNISYLWKFGDNGISYDKNPIYLYQTHGIFEVTLTISETHGTKVCKVVDTLLNSIEVFQKPNSRFYPTPEIATNIKPEIYFENRSENAIDALWHFDDGDSSNLMSPYHRFDTVGDYKVKLIAISEYGCKDTSSKIISIVEQYSFYAPNAFTPDGDGINDVYFFKHSGIIDEGFLFNVYDRYGHVIYSTTNKDQSWDGSVYGNKKAKTGVYVYLVTYVNYMNIEYTKSGTLNVIY